MPKIINKYIGKSKQRENSATLPLPDISSSPGFLAALDLDYTISTLSILISTKYKPNIGLFELSTNETEKAIDVVAVHRLQGDGLQGDVYKKWKNDNGSVRLWDFLPADILNTSIMTFRYNSAVAFNKSVARMKDKAFELLNHFSVKQLPVTFLAPSKPIVLICHSLRRIVIKRAIILGH